MLALRYAGLLALVVWIGGVVVLGGIVAPAVFEVVTARNVTDGGGLSGAVFGEILRRFHLVAYACAGVFVASLLTRAVLGPRPRGFGARLGIAMVMLAAALYSGRIVSPRIEALRREIGVSPSSLAEGDERRATFAVLHGWSTALQLVPLAGGLALLVWELKD